MHSDVAYYTCRSPARSLEVRLRSSEWKIAVREKRIPHRGSARKREAIGRSRNVSQLVAFPPQTLKKCRSFVKIWTPHGGFYGKACRGISPRSTCCAQPSISYISRIETSSLWEICRVSSEVYYIIYFIISPKEMVLTGSKQFTDSLFLHYFHQWIPNMYIS